MKIFILEDAEERIEAFLKIAGHDYTIAKTVRSAKKKWAPPYDLILLDHDLADEHYDIGHFAHEGTGTEFAEWLGTQEVECPIIIHSYNADGASRMLEILHRAGHNCLKLPFGTGILAYLEGTVKPKG